MKVAVYTIALNEQQFVERWYNSCKDADYILIADTGSTDNTVKIAEKLGINVLQVSVKPWRFDDARNASLAALPDDIDYCIALDMDEVITTPDWRRSLEIAQEQGVTRPRYKYIWSWKDNGDPDVMYGGDKIHARHGYRWKHPVHEALYTDRLEEVQKYMPNFQIEHYPDKTKSRSSYLGLLKLSVEEDPYNDRNAYYYARELFFNLQYEEAAVQFKRHLKLPTATWDSERAASYRYLSKCDPNHKEHWLMKARDEAPHRREALVELADHFYSKQNWQKCLQFAEEAIAIEEKPLDYLCEEFAWGSRPWDYAAFAAYSLGDLDKAMQYGSKAVELEPTNLRLQANIAFYSKE